MTPRKLAKRLDATDLSPREIEVTYLSIAIALGPTAIAKRLGISRNAADTYLRRAREKFPVNASRNRTRFA